MSTRHGRTDGRDDDAGSASGLTLQEQQILRVWRAFRARFFAKEFEGWQFPMLTFHVDGSGQFSVRNRLGPDEIEERVVATVAEELGYRADRAPERYVERWTRVRLPKP